MKREGKERREQPRQDEHNLLTVTPGPEGTPEGGAVGERDLKDGVCVLSRGKKRRVFL